MSRSVEVGKASVQRPPIKTAQAALKEAQRRWGKTACVSENKRAALQPEKLMIRTLYAGLPLPRTLHYLHGSRCSVGKIVMGMAHMIEGSGDTWDAAFADADAREVRRG